MYGSGCLFGFFTLIIFAVLSLLINVVRFFAGAKQAARDFMNGGKESVHREKQKPYAGAGTRPSGKRRTATGKFFAQSEGEYVEFEEIEEGKSK